MCVCVCMYIKYNKVGMLMKWEYLYLNEISGLNSKR